MPRGLKRAGGAIFLATTAVFFVGCDSDQNDADKQTRAALVEIHQSAGGETAEPARKKLEDASVAASPGPRAAAKAALAQNQFEIAQDAILKIDRAELQLAKVGWEITQLAHQIRNGGTAVAGSKLYDPRSAKEAIAAAIVEAEGGPSKPAWFTTGSAVLPTLSAAKQEVAKLEGELTQLKDQLKNLTDQRTKLIDDAEQSALQSDQLKGAQSVEAYKRSSDLRRQAGEVSVKSDLLENDIRKTQSALDVAKGQLSSVSEAISQLQDQTATLDRAWKEVDSKSLEHQKLAAQILGSPVAPPAGDQPAPSTAGGTMSQKAAELDRLVKEIRKLRGDAQLNLANATRFYDEAYKAANELNLQLSQAISNGPERPEVSAWTNMRDVMDPAQFKLREAAAKRTLGILYASEAASLSSRIAMLDAVRNAVAGTELRIPPEVVGGDMNTERANALKSADTALKEADELLEPVIQATKSFKQLPNLARISRVLVQYEWAQVARIQGDTAGALAHIQAAKQARDEAAANDAVIPSLPAELGLPPKPAAPTPEGGTPTTEPAAAPAAPAANAADSPEQAAVRAAMVAFGDAMDKGDVNAARAFLQIEPGQEEFAAQLLQVPVAMKKVETAMTSKFGPQTAQQSGEGKFKFSSTSGRDDFAKTKIDVKGDTAIIDDDDSPMSKVTRINGQWKFVLGAPKDDKERQERAVMTKLISAMNTLAADIEAGKYAKADEAGMAFMGVIFEAAGAAAGPGVAPGSAATGSPAPAAPRPGPQ